MRESPRNPSSPLRDDLCLIPHLQDKKVYDLQSHGPSLSSGPPGGGSPIYSWSCLRFLPVQGVFSLPLLLAQGPGAGGRGPGAGGRGPGAGLYFCGAPAALCFVFGTTRSVVTFVKLLWKHSVGDCKIETLFCLLHGFLFTT